MNWFDTNLALVFVNAFELAIAIFVILILLRYAIGKVRDVPDFFRRCFRLLNRDFQGGPYDLAIAIMVVFVGKAIRTGTVWHWRVFDPGAISVPRLSVGVAISAIGAVCLIRILSPSEHFMRYWIAIIASSLIFGAWSVYLA